MKKLSVIVVVLFSLGLLLSCGGKKEPTVNHTTENSNSTNDSVPEDQPEDQPEDDSDLTTGNEALDFYLADLNESWANVPDPITAKYVGYELGDYQHVLFEGENGDVLDFGNGNNVYGEYENDMLIEGSPYAGKTFKVSWDWVKSDFYCCEGEMTTVRAKVPSITGLEMVE